MLPHLYGTSMVVFFCLSFAHIDSIAASTTDEPNTSGTSSVRVSHQSTKSVSVETEDDATSTTTNGYLHSTTASTTDEPNMSGTSLAGAHPLTKSVSTETTSTPTTTAKGTTILPNALRLEENDTTTWKGSRLAHGHISIMTNLLNITKWIERTCKSLNDPASECLAGISKIEVTTGGEIRLHYNVTFQNVTEHPKHGVDNRTLTLQENMMNSLNEFQITGEIKASHLQLMEGCRNGSFECPGEAICIPDSYVCNYRQDCRESVYDEEICVPEGNCLERYQWTCSDSICIPLSEKCDGVNDCTSGDDEQFCPLTAASQTTPSQSSDIFLSTLPPHPTTVESLDEAANDYSAYNGQIYQFDGDEDSSTLASSTKFKPSNGDVTSENELTKPSGGKDASADGEEDYLMLAITLPVITVVLFLLFGIVLCVYVTRRERAILDMHVKNVKEKRKVKREQRKARKMDEEMMRWEEEQRRRVEQEEQETSLSIPEGEGFMGESTDEPAPARPVGSRQVPQAVGRGQVPVVIGQVPSTSGLGQIPSSGGLKQVPPTPPGGVTQAPSKGGLRQRPGGGALKQVPSSGSRGQVTSTPNSRGQAFAKPGSKPDVIVLTGGTEGESDDGQFPDDIMADTKM